MIILRPGAQAPSFPPVESATPEGLLAVGGDLSSERLLAAYRHGIFPGTTRGNRSCGGHPIRARCSILKN